MKRVLSYNSRVETPPEFLGVSSELVPGLALPRSSEAHYLFGLELQEDRFQKTDKDWTSTLTDAGVLDGVLVLKHLSITRLSLLSEFFCTETLSCLENEMEGLAEQGFDTQRYCVKGS